MVKTVGCYVSGRSPKAYAARVFEVFTPFFLPPFRFSRQYCDRTCPETATHSRVSRDTHAQHEAYFVHVGTSKSYDRDIMSGARSFIFSRAVRTALLHPRLDPLPSFSRHGIFCFCSFSTDASLTSSTRPPFLVPFVLFLSQFFHGVVFVPVILSMLPDRLVSHRAGTAVVAHGDSSAKVRV